MATSVTRRLPPAHQTTRATSPSTSTTGAAGPRHRGRVQEGGDDEGPVPVAVVPMQRRRLATLQAARDPATVGRGVADDDGVTQRGGRRGGEREEGLGAVGDEVTAGDDLGLQPGARARPRRPCARRRRAARRRPGTRRRRRAAPRRAAGARPGPPAGCSRRAPRSRRAVEVDVHLGDLRAARPQERAAHHRLVLAVDGHGGVDRRAAVHAAPRGVAVLAAGCRGSTTRSRRRRSRSRRARRRGRGRRWRGSQRAGVDGDALPGGGAQHDQSPVAGVEGAGVAGGVGQQARRARGCPSWPRRPARGQAGSGRQVRGARAVRREDVEVVGDRAHGLGPSGARSPRRRRRSGARGRRPTRPAR